MTTITKTSTPTTTVATSTTSTMKTTTTTTTTTTITTTTIVRFVISTSVATTTVATSSITTMKITTTTTTTTTTSMIMITTSTLVTTRSTITAGTITTTAQTPPTLEYDDFAAGHPKHCSSDFIRYQDGVSSLSTCQQMCSGDVTCQFVSYNSAALGEKRCGIYASQCQGQEQVACGNHFCYRTYRKKQQLDNTPISEALPVARSKWSVLLASLLLMLSH